MARILVADDDPKQAELIRRYAVAEGHTVTVVGDGSAALDAVRSSLPDLLILDVMMPALDGHDVCRAAAGGARVGGAADPHADRQGGRGRPAAAGWTSGPTTT